MGKFFRCVILVALGSGLVQITGCANMNDVIVAKDTGKEGTTSYYDIPSDQAWKIARIVFRWEGSDAIEEHRDEGYMLTSSGIGFMTAGTLMGAWIADAPDGRSRVTVVTKRRVQTNVVTTLTEETFQKRFAQAVAIVKAGGSLPVVAPASPI